MLFVPFCLYSLSHGTGRENLINYYEVFIDSPINDPAIQRDLGGLYRQFNEGKIRNVAGLDLEFIIPEMPDLLIKNDSTLDDFLLNASLEYFNS